MTNNNERLEQMKKLRGQFLTLIWIGFRNFMKRVQKYGLTHPQFVTLFALVNHQHPANMRQLTEVTFQDAPTMTGIVNRLVKMNLVQRTRSEEDRRVVWVEATQDGIDLAQTIEQDFERDDPQGFGKMTDAEISKMEQMFDFMWLLNREEIQRLGIPNIETAKEKLSKFADDPIAFIKEQE